MRIAITRSAEPGCGKPCTEWIAAEGRIVPETLTRFREVLRSVGDRQLPVFISSPGGSVETALAMGRLIRARHLDVAVSKTVPAFCGSNPAPCPAKDEGGVALGTPLVASAFCASACAFILASGESRFVAPGTLVGVHEMTSRQVFTKVMRMFHVTRRVVRGVPTEIGRTLVDVKPLSRSVVEGNASSELYDTVARFFEEMGVRPGLMPFLRSTPPTSMHWLTRDELEATRLATSPFGADYLVQRANARDAFARGSVALLPASLTPVQKLQVTRKIVADAAHSERAFLVVRPGGTDGQRVLGGRVTWSSAAAAEDGTKAPGSAVLEAMVSIPEARLDVTVRMRKSNAPATVPSYAASVLFSSPPDGLVSGVKDVKPPDFRSLPFVAGAPLASSATPMSPNDWRIAIPTSQRDSALFQLGSPGWMGVVFTTTAGELGTVTVEKGVTGYDAIGTTLADWGEQQKATGP